MITFRGFLHGDNWKKPLLPDLTKATGKIIRSGQQGAVADWQAAPPHQKLMMALARAGQRD